MSNNPLYEALFAPHLERDVPFLRLSEGQTLNFRDFLHRAAKFAAVFRQLGVSPGDRIAVQVAKSPEALALYAACVQSGIVFLPLNTAYTLDEVGYFLNDSGAELFICDAQRLKESEDRFGVRVLSLNPDGSGSLMKRADEGQPVWDVVPRSTRDLAALLYTSGTTGRSKGAMLTQENLLSNASVLVDQWRFSAQDVLLHALPIFHTHGLFVATNIALLSGAQMIFLPKFDVSQVLDQLPKATSMMGVPTFYTRLLEDPRFTKDLCEQMRLFISGSAPLLAETHQLFERRTGHRILERYGMTETNMTTSNPYEGERRAGTVGLPLPGVEVKITDPQTGKVLPHGQTGDIEVRGPNVFQGYWQMPEKTAEELRDDGFFITGDLGQIDADGYVTIVGRAKDLVISGGYNIYPKEIEGVLDAQPGVLESAVIGVPHPDFGETPVAVLVAVPGEIPDLEEIKDALAQSLARFKHPQSFVILEELPRNTMGKVQKNVLRDQFRDLFSN